MKKVLIVRSNPIEPDSRVEKEANSLAKSGYIVTLFGWNRSENYIIRKDEKQLADSKVQRVTVGAKAEFGAGFKSIVPFFKFQCILFLWILKNGRKYDLLHFCDFDTAFSGSCAARVIGKKYLFDIFDYLSTSPKSLFQKIIKRMEDNIINNAEATIICTEKRREQIKDAKPRNLTVIHNSPPRYVTQNTGREQNCRVKIAYVGVLLDHRLLDKMLEAVSEMPDTVELHIGGFGKYEELVAQYANRNDNIVFYGKLAYEDTIHLEERCDIMTAIYAPYIGNHYYAAPNKFYEGLMLGKPLIMVRETGMSEYIEQYKIGALIDYSKEGFIAGIQELIRQKVEWGTISERMKEIYRNEFSWDEMEKRLLCLYENI